MSDIVIRVENLSKKYTVGRARGTRSSGDGLRHALQDAVSTPWRVFRQKGMRQVEGGSGAYQDSQPLTLSTSSEDFWALNDVSFEVKRGEVLGIIGRNGAGKSTLLKVLSRITEPTAGRIGIRGRVASLLEVGTGFHPELTGRENIFLNGAILGMSRAEIKAKFDEIVAFAEVEKFLELPVKRFSSGMYVRLAFAVAAHLEPEIIIVDEVLAVGDTAFQAKCIGKMKSIAASGRTVVFVSHSMATVSNLCTTAVYLEKGQSKHRGNASELVRYYLQQVLPAAINDTALTTRTDRSGNQRVKMVKFWIEDDNGSILSEATTGMDLTFVLEYVAMDEITTNVDAGISCHGDGGNTLFVLYTSYLSGLLTLNGRSGELRCRIPRLPLNSGKYTIGARIVVQNDEADWPADGVGFLTVEPGDFYRSGSNGCSGATSFLVDGAWSQQPRVAV